MLSQTGVHCAQEPIAVPTLGGKTHTEGWMLKTDCTIG